MTKLHQSFQEDRQLRDSARAVLISNIAHARTSFSAKGVADRVGGRIGDGAKDVFEVAKTHSGDKGGIIAGIIAGLIGGVLLFLTREPILELLGLSDPQDDAVKTEADPELGPSAKMANAGDPIPHGDDDEHP